VSYVPYVDSGACAAHGDCVAAAPDVFRVDEETGEQIYP
jgi:ferredoxin